MTENTVSITTAAGPLDCRVQPPGSKSITNRAMLLASLATGRSVLSGVLDSEDSRLMSGALQQLGVAISHDWRNGRCVIDGCGGVFPVRRAELSCGNSGTTIRFLAAALGISGGEYLLDGIPRMRQRPIGDLIDAMNQLGADAVAESPGGCPPVRIAGNRLQGGIATVAASISSQYTSALLMALPLAERSSRLVLKGKIVSQPYIEMTLTMMREFGIEVARGSAGEFMIPAGTYSPRDYLIEPDASAASYFFAAAAIMGGSVTVTNLNRDCMQGDIRFVELLQRAGCGVRYHADSICVTGPATSAIDCDMGQISDTAQTMAVVALFVPGTTTIRGIAHNREKETDRIGNLAIELRKTGATVTEHPDGMSISSGSLKPATFDTWNDHRMAMSLALIGLRQPGIVIRNPECVAKTFPDYFEVLRSLTN